MFTHESAPLNPVNASFGSNSMSSEDEKNSGNVADAEEDPDVLVDMGELAGNDKKKGKRKNKGRKDKDEKPGTRLREINALLRDIDFIETKCGGKSNKAKLSDASNDSFQRAKKDLFAHLKSVKEDIKIRKGIQERMGNTQETIKLKHKIDSNLETVKQYYADMESAYQVDRENRDNGREDALSAKELDDRAELVKLMKQDIDYTESEFKPKKEERGGGYGLAREVRRKREEKRAGSPNMKSEPVPLTARQQQFIQMSMERKDIQDEKLEIILTGVKQVNQMAVDVTDELEKQAIILEEVESKMDKVQDKMDVRNKQLKDLINSAGGVQRWCPVLILLIILIALAGYIYNLLTAK